MSREPQKGVRVAGHRFPVENSVLLSPQQKPDAAFYAVDHDDQRYEELDSNF